MTNKEAIEILEKEREEYIVKGCELDRALDAAIEALSTEAAQVNGNLVSKRDAIEAVICHIWHTPPEVRKLFNCENYVRDVVEDAFERLPLIPDRQRGKWVAVEVCDGGVRYQCDQCGDEIIIFDETPEENGFSFCSNCGADMRKGGENK